MNLIIRSLITGLTLATASQTALAAPWLEPGDPRARSAAQALANQGGEQVLVTTWPVTWGELKQGARKGTPQPYLSFEQQEQSERSFRGEVSLQGQTQQPPIASFEPNLNADANASLNLQWQGKVWAAGLKTTYAHEPFDDDEFRLDGSYLAAAAGNWVLGVGAIDRWWGPGWQSSLILSNNGRPIEGVWLNRNISHAPDSPLLSWIGPWHFTLLAGQSQQGSLAAGLSREDDELAAARFTFRPFSMLELGISSAVIDEGSVTVNGNAIDTENRKLSTLDFRFSPAIGSKTIGLYAQAREEHGQSQKNTDRPWLAGTDWTTSLFDAGQQWFLEFTNDDVYTLGGYHFFNHGANFGATISLAETEDENITTATLSYGQQALGGWMKLEASASDKEIADASGKQDKYTASASWTYRF